ncbi:MAG TPA: hypothetical protein VF631_11640 [Allosphingosinicella sp.]|jgi:hypothetical protein|uniref:hypothetical protein n=1 Tax=Allosphingosinicella sp. TaxID=2823234 RepID=UPI002F28EF34
MDPFDRDYYLARIAAEENAADSASHPLAALSHRRLAEEYASLIEATDSLSGCFSDADPVAR